MRQKIAKIILPVVIILAIFINDSFLHFVKADIGLVNVGFFKSYLMKVVSGVGIATCLFFIIFVIPFGFIRKK